jgi:hypothetical protein
VACRALPGLTLAAAVRTSRADGLPTQPIPRTLLPIGQRSRLATAITDGAGVLLPHPFTPYQGCPWRDCSLLPSCVPAPFRVRGPRFRFRGVAFHWSRAAQWARSREVPLEHNVSSDGIWRTRSLLISISHTMVHRKHVRDILLSLIYETRKGMRYTISEEARTDLLDTNKHGLRWTKSYHRIYIDVVSGNMLAVLRVSRSLNWKE